MKRYLFSAFCVLTVYFILLGPFTRTMEQKPYIEKLGLIPNPRLLSALFPDYQELLAASIIGKVILYYGSLAERLDQPGKVIYAADYPAMSRSIHAALRLDPYNMDGYYFGQSILAWDARQYVLATKLLEYGMQYRTWDWQLPFFAGFNYAYFLHDKEKAAEMYMRAGDLSGEPLFQKLAGRYLQEAGDTRMAIDYLGTLAKNARNPALRQTLQVRISAFEAVLAIEQARDRFMHEHGNLPANIADLVEAGYLEDTPIDPYGGEFYFDENHRVLTTSKFAFAAPRVPSDDDSSESPE
ncbi:MAG: hypothetical protein WDA02_04780 [Saccharofermentanales bacterium]